MWKAVGIVVFMAGGAPAIAQNCPDFFRFADFGLQDQNGQFTRGGPIFRGESFTGTSLLHRDQTQCRALSNISTDGHGNPIPVVTKITYNVERAGLDLSHLRVVFSADSRQAAEDNAQAHRSAVQSRGAIQGERSLCSVSGGSASCQIVSPYPGTAPLVVYCSGDTCAMPVIAVNPHIFVSASWSVDVAFWDDIDDIGPNIVGEVQTIHTFLEPLSSGL